MSGQINKVLAEDRMRERDSWGLVRQRMDSVEFSKQSNAV